MDRSAEDPRLRPGSPRARLLLSLLLLFHLLALLVHLGPRGQGHFALLPGPAERVLEATVPRLVGAAEPVFLPYLRFFSLEQNWHLFAPEPLEWANWVEAIVYFREAGETSVAPEDLQAGPQATEDGEWADESWTAERVRVRGALDDGLPRHGGHREYRLSLNVAFEGWREVYAPILAREVCRQEEKRTGVRPVAVVLESHWIRTPVPWRGEPERWREREELGAFPCPGATGVVQGDQVNGMGQPSGETP